MKKGLIIIVLLLSLNLALADNCEPTASLVSQDPYPAIPGEYVKIVFQVDDISDTTCKNLEFELLEKYPIVFDPGANPITRLDGGFYDKNYGSFLIAPYKVRVNEAALDGDNPIEVRYRTSSNMGYFLDEFNINIEDSIADFEIHIDKYSYATKEMTLEILNIADTDIEALTLEIPEQENINIVGTNRVIAGDIDSNEYTTADFVAEPQAGQINIKVLYTDQTGTRREITKAIDFNPSYFESTKTSNKPGLGTYTIIILIVVGLIWWLMKRNKKNKSRLRRQHKGAKVSF